MGSSRLGGSLRLLVLLLNRLLITLLWGHLLEALRGTAHGLCETLGVSLMGTSCIVERLVERVVHTVLLALGILPVFIGTLTLVVETLLLEGLLLLADANHALLHHLSHLQHHLLALAAIGLLHLHHLLIEFLLLLLLFLQEFILLARAKCLCEGNLSPSPKMFSCTLAISCSAVMLASTLSRFISTFTSILWMVSVERFCS